MNYIELSKREDSITMNNIGTESATSPNMLSASMNKKTTQKGGFWFFQNNGANNLLLKACREREFAALSFIVRNDIVTDFCAVDPTTGCSVLHCIAKFYDNIPHVSEVVEKILNSSDISGVINKQDDNGNTALHIALENENQDLCDALIQHGADPKVRNKKGQYILTDDEPTVECKMNTKRVDIHKHFDVDEDISKRVELSATPSRRTDIFMKKPRGNSTSSAKGSDNLTSDNIVDILLALENRRNPSKQTDYSMDMPTSLPTDTSQMSQMADTDAFIRDILQRGPSMAKVPTTNSLPINEFMTGGKNKNKVLVKGNRRMNMYSEFDNLNGGSEESDENELESDITLDDDDSYDSDENDGGLSRQVKSQVDIIHERTVDKIAEIMGVDRDIARNYKAALYREVKESKPELSGYERAIEMEKLATKDHLKKIDIKKISAEIAKHLAEKPPKPEHTKKEENVKKEKKAKKTKLDSSSSDLSDSALSESDMSPTSAY